MGDPIGTAISCIQIIEAIYSLHDQVCENDSEMVGLMSAVLEIAGHLETLKCSRMGAPDSKNYISKKLALESLTLLLTEIDAFVKKRSAPNIFTKMMFAKSTKEKTEKYLAKLDQCTSRLHFGLTVEEHCKNDERDGFVREQIRQGNAENCYKRHTIAGAVDNQSLLGRGAFGETHAVLNIATNVQYALKVINIKDAAENGCPLTKLCAEASLLECMRHPNIVRYIAQFHSEQGRYFNIVMELVEGGRLSEKVSIHPPVSPLEIVCWLKETASALAYMHEGVKVLHRDIKPDNILLSGGAKPSIKIIDLGLACVAQSSAAAARSMAGNTTYSSYEKAHQIAYDGRDDVWATGLVFAELLTGKRTHERGGAMYLHTNKEVSKRHALLLQDCDAAHPVSPASCAEYWCTK